MRKRIAIAIGVMADAIGGADHSSFGTIQANSEVRNGNATGVVKLTLRDGAYDWQFVSAGGSSFTDSGSGVCH